jgi:hypothetical protein
MAGFGPKPALWLSELLARTMDDLFPGACDLAALRGFEGL